MCTLDILKYSLLLIRQHAILSAQIFAACVPPPTSAALFPINWLKSDSLVHRHIDSRLKAELASRVCPQGRIISVDCRYSVVKRVMLDM